MSTLVAHAFLCGADVFFGPSAMAAFVPALGFESPVSEVSLPLHWLYNYAWFAGFGVSGAVYVMLMQRAEAHGSAGNLAGEEGEA